MNHHWKRVPAIHHLRDRPRWVQPFLRASRVVPANLRMPVRPKNLRRTVFCDGGQRSPAATQMEVLIRWQRESHEGPFPRRVTKRSE
jgi:hypothetical protein